MKRKEFDNELKNKLENFHSKVDVGNLWAAIENDVEAVNNNETKKRKFIWFFSLLVGLMALSSLFFIWEKTKIDTNVKQSSTLENSKVESSILPTNKKTFTTEKNKIQKNEIETGLTSNTKSKTPTISKQLSNQSDDQTSTSFPKNKNTKNIRANFPASIPVRSAFSNFDNSSVQNVIIPKGNSSFVFENEKTENTTSKKNASSKIPLTERTRIPVVFLFEKNQNTIPTNFVFENQKEESNTSLPFPRYYQLPPKWTFSIGAQSGVSLLQRKLSTTHSEAYPYITQREESEKTLEAFQIGVHGNVMHRSGFEFSIGLQMTQFNEAFETQQSSTVFDTIPNGLYGYYVNPNGDSIPAYDEVINSRQIDFSKKTINHYRMLDVPILLGYHFQKEKWSVGIQAGIIANLRLKTKGAMLNELGEIENLEANQNSFFKSNVGWSYHLGASGRFFITKHLQISINPFFRGFPKSFTQSNFSLNQKYQMFGGSTGMNYVF